jgi:acetylglutamate kinase
LNVNGDDAAAAIAAELGAAELLLLADVEGVLADGRVIPALDADGAATLIAAGTAAGGMAAKLEAALRALDAGVPRVRIGGVGALVDQSSGTALTPARSLV